MTVLTFRPAVVPAKPKSKKKQVNLISLEEFDAGCEGVRLMDRSFDGCAAIVRGGGEFALYCNAKRLNGCSYCRPHASYFYNGDSK